MSTPDQQNQPPAYTPPPADPAAPSYQTPPAAPGYAGPAYPAPETVPGKGLAIAGLILAFVAPIVGLILSLVAKSKLKKAGAPTGLATAGFWIGLALTILWIIGIALSVFLFASLFNVCEQLGPGVWDVNGTTYTCG
jgi:hypothetical protein